MTKPRRTSRYGFTLVELLVAVAVLGILISAVIALTSGFLGFSRRVSFINERLEDLNDAMGYVGLAARASSATYGGDAPLTITVAGIDGVDVDVPCATGSTSAPCIAFLVPVVERSATNPRSLVTAYELRAYRIVPIDEWTNNPGFTGTRPVLLEYRAPVACSGSCVGADVPVVVSPVLMNDGPSLVISDLTVEGYVPFAFATDDTEFTISLRVAGAGLLEDLIVPTEGPLSLTTKSRP